MIPGIVWGFGIGLAAYACVKILFGWVSSQGLPASSEPLDALQVQEVAPATVPVESAQEILSQPQRTVEVVHEEHEEEAPLEKEESPEQYLDSASDTTDEDQVPESKSWYLIATSKGLLRACKCSAPTSHTVAGPFSSKKAAQQAKQQYEGRSVRPLGTGAPNDC